MKKAAKSLREEAAKVQTAFARRLASILPKIEQPEADERELVDAGFYLREAEDAIDDARKELAAKRRAVEGRLSALVEARGLEAGEPVETSKGEAAYARYRLVFNPAFPNRGSDEEREMYESVGLSVDSTFVPSFTATSRELSRQAEGGVVEPKLPGVGSLSEYKVTFVKRSQRKKKSPVAN